jgi:glycerophosphoryl diester phosphodiesterase
MAVIVIGHRGACGYRPEHTLESYELAARLGADFLEPDLVSTRDGVLVARHENEISETTDVAARPEFASRRTVKEIGGREVAGWFTEDFTLAELRQLRARERIPSLRPANAAFDGRFVVPTFAEVVALAERLSDELGRELGLYPETKHPEYFASIGLALEDPLVEALGSIALPVFVQSFGDNLPALRPRVRVPLVQLLGGRAPVDLAAIAAYADAVGPHTERIVPRDEAGRSLPPTSFVDDAHAAGLAVHAFTFRSENAFLPAELRSSDDPAAHGDALAECRAFYDLGVDAVFSDFPDVAVAARGGGGLAAGV